MGHTAGDHLQGCGDESSSLGVVGKASRWRGAAISPPAEPERWDAQKGWQDLAELEWKYVQDGMARTNHPNTHTHTCTQTHTTDH